MDTHYCFVWVGGGGGGGSARKRSYKKESVLSPPTSQTLAARTRARAHIHPHMHARTYARTSNTRKRTHTRHARIHLHARTHPPPPPHTHTLAWLEDDQHYNFAWHGCTQQNKQQKHLLDKALHKIEREKKDIYKYINLTSNKQGHTE